LALVALLSTLQFFFFTLPRPPTSTLFPYTTLFRSCSTGGASRTSNRSGSVRSREGEAPPSLPSGVRGSAEPGQSSSAEPRTPEGDRKSTRLNSSHSQISYAVFCLKKKKIKKVNNYN